MVVNARLSEPAGAADPTAASSCQLGTAILADRPPESMDTSRRSTRPARRTSPIHCPSVICDGLPHAVVSSEMASKLVRRRPLRARRSSYQTENRTSPRPNSQPKSVKGMPTIEDSVVANVSPPPSIPRARPRKRSWCPRGFAPPQDALDRERSVELEGEDAECRTEQAGIWPGDLELPRRRLAPRVLSKRGCGSFTTWSKTRRSNP